MTYISKIEDLCSAQIKRFSKVQFRLVSELEARNIKYSFSLCAGDGWERAVLNSKSFYSSSAYFHIRIEADHATTQRAVSNVQSSIRRSTECSHIYKDCGCTSLERLAAAEMFENHYIIYEKWVKK
jgi:hypothetical protein